MFWVVVGTDAAGGRVTILHDEDARTGGEDPPFQLAARNEDQSLALRVAARLSTALREDTGRE
jgi:hypothetical protein